jgi:D-glycero-alpha-D-manno-heptose 1-phosphate guanylyltransferase
MRRPDTSTTGDLAGVSGAILAGGLGTRLHSVVADRPKVLAEIHGRPFLAYLLDLLIAGGMRYVVLCTGYLGEQVQRVFGNSYGSLRLVYSQEPAPQDTGGALRLAAPLFKSDFVLAMNGDSYCEVDLKALWTWHRSHGADATLLLTKIADTKRYGRVQVDAKGRVLSFDEKDGKSEPGWVNAGMYLLNYDLFSTIPATGTVSLERELFPAWIGRGVYGFQTGGPFLDIGTPEAYAAARQFFPVGSRS